MIFFKFILHNITYRYNNINVSVVFFSRYISFFFHILYTRAIKPTVRRIRTPRVFNYLKNNFVGTANIAVEKREGNSDGCRGEQRVAGGVNKVTKFMFLNRSEETFRV